jgi:hypothetical protein
MARMGAVLALMGESGRAAGANGSQQAVSGAISWKYLFVIVEFFLRRTMFGRASMAGNPPNID